MTTEKNSYFRLFFDGEIKGWLLSTPKAKSIEITEWAFTKGVRWEQNHELYSKIEYKGPVLPISFTSVRNALIVRGDVVDILKPILREDEVQVIPVEVENQKDEFFIFNIIKIVDCMDKEKSVFRLFDETWFDKSRIGQIKSIEKLVVNPESLKGTKMVRMKDPTSRIIIDNEVKEILEKNNVIGVKYLPAM
jgi:hypothetical protein